MQCRSLPCNGWLFVVVLRSGVTSPRFSSRLYGALMLSNVPTFSFSRHVWMIVTEVSMTVCVSLWWLQQKTQLISNWERAVGRLQKTITLSPLMEARDSWSSYSGKARPSSGQSFILSKGSFILPKGYVVKNIPNDDSNTRWLKMLEWSFTSHEKCQPIDLFFDIQGQCCLLEPKDSFDIAVLRLS